jgi:hypothetical protein
MHCCGDCGGREATFARSQLYLSETSSAVLEVSASQVGESTNGWTGGQTGGLGAPRKLAGAYSGVGSCGASESQRLWM